MRPTRPPLHDPPTLRGAHAVEDPHVAHDDLHSKTATRAIGAVSDHLLIRTQTRGSIGTRGPTTASIPTTPDTYVRMNVVRIQLKGFGKVLVGEGG